ADMPLIERVLARIGLFSVAAGERIIKEGALETALYIVYAGRFSVKKSRFLLLSRQVAVLGPGDFCGEMALLVNEAKRTATVAAEEPGRVFKLSGDDFQDLLRRNPDFRQHLMHVAQARKTLGS
ncbi:MAG: cyclic nucleotide-binding domain-containing protein, partial [Elusimicrobia bacterium]|nr:cyclic nucleotide-binding domain-containing protein [Elusimicrobiota bacterium]